MPKMKPWTVFDGIHNATCVFQEWDKETKSMKSCGMPAYGMTAKKECLCANHFEYARQAQGVPMALVLRSSAKTTDKKITGDKSRR